MVIFYIFFAAPELKSENTDDTRRCRNFKLNIFRRLMLLRNVQVDAAEGAEQMASALTYDKMMLQEEVEKLREEISDMEAIESANDQLLEEHKELEIELNERLDMTLARLREVNSHGLIFFCWLLMLYISGIPWCSYQSYGLGLGPVAIKIYYFASNFKEENKYSTMHLERFQKLY